MLSAVSLHNPQKQWETTVRESCGETRPQLLSYSPKLTTVRAWLEPRCLHSLPSGPSLRSHAAILDTALHMTAGQETGLCPCPHRAPSQHDSGCNAEDGVNQGKGTGVLWGLQQTRPCSIHLICFHPPAFKLTMDISGFCTKPATNSSSGCNEDI